MDQTRLEKIKEIEKQIYELLGESNNINFKLSPEEYFKIVNIRNYANTIIENEWWGK